MVDLLANAPLGRDTPYPTLYDPNQLFPIARAGNRQSLGSLPQWAGADIWNAYEVSWLNAKGKPIVAMGRFVVPQSSPNLIESKSLKLYLNSFNETHFESVQTVCARIAQDLSAAAGVPVDVAIEPLENEKKEVCRALEGINIDGLDIAVGVYKPEPGLLRCLEGAPWVNETLASDLLKTNCPVTGQPDWGSVQIRYRGSQIDRAGLLEYIVSLRQHNEFHEHCVEQMYCDIWRACKPESLLVYARYTRRGGLDINPWRGSENFDVGQERTVRQ